MSKGVNKAILVGNLGGDPEVRTTGNGSTVTNITVATSESWTDKSSGQKQERTEWHRVVLFNKLGEIAGQFLRKGSKVYLEGSLRTRKWQDQQGQDRYTTEIVANDMQMLDSGGASQNAGQPNQNQNQGGYQPHAAPQNGMPVQGGYQMAPPQQ